MPQERFEAVAIGWVRSSLRALERAPKQGDEGAPRAWVELDPRYAPALDGVQAGAAMVVITWLHRADRELLQVHPRDDASRPLTGVFATRSPDRPNPLGLHRVEVIEIESTRVRVSALEAVDGTPVVDLKPAISAEASER